MSRKLALLYRARFVGDEFIDDYSKVRLAVITKSANLISSHSVMLSNIIHKVFNLDDSSVRILSAEYALGSFSGSRDMCFLIFDPSLCKLLQIEGLREDIGVVQSVSDSKFMCTYSLGDLERNVALKRRSMAHFMALKNYLAENFS